MLLQTKLVPTDLRKKTSENRRPDSFKTAKTADRQVGIA
jgi:hypothetical protein